MQNQPAHLDYAVTYIIPGQEPLDPIGDHPGREGTLGLAWHGNLYMLMGTDEDPALECGDFGYECADVQDEYIHTIGTVIVTAGGMSNCLHSALQNGTIIQGWRNHLEIAHMTDEQVRIDPDYNRLLS